MREFYASVISYKRLLEAAEAVRLYKHSMLNMNSEDYILALLELRELENEVRSEKRLLSVLFDIEIADAPHIALH